MMEDKTEKKLLEEIKKIDRPKRLVSRNAIKVYFNEAYDYMDILKAKLQQHRETKKETLQPIIDTIKARENKQHIGTLVRIMNYCKKEISNEQKNI